MKFTNARQNNHPVCAGFAGLLLFVILLVSAATLNAAETPIPPAPQRWVTDTVNFMSPQTASSLDAQLETYERSTGHQLIVWIGATTGDAPIEDWAVRAFEKWKVGRKGIDDGLVLFIMAQDRKLRIEVGYGLEGQVPDSIAARIIDEEIVPRIRSGNNDSGVVAGMNALMTVVGGGSLPPQRSSGRQQRPLTLGQMILYGIIGIFVLLFIITHPSLALFILMNMASGNRRGGGSWDGGGGGFGGGGGRSGGGGASGSW